VRPDQLQLRCLVLTLLRLSFPPAAAAAAAAGAPLRAARREHFCCTTLANPATRLTSCNASQLWQAPVQGGLASLKAGAHAGAGAGLLTTVTETAGASLQATKATQNTHGATT
jgi:hypothetical protein